MTIKIILADDHTILRQGLCSLIQQEEDLQVIAEAANGRETLQLVGQLSPDLVVIDVTMPDMNGIQATRKIKKKFYGVHVLALSMHDNRQFVTGMIEAGASGYLLKDSAFEELVQAIRTISSKKTYISPKVTDVLFRKPRGDSTSPDLSSLTDREREVLQLLAEGLSSKDIADHIGLKSKTVDTHRRNIMIKLGIDNIADLTKYAIREGITHP